MAQNPLATMSHDVPADDATEDRTAFDTIDDAVAALADDDPEIEAAPETDEGPEADEEGDDPDDTEADEEGPDEEEPESDEGRVVQLPDGQSVPEAELVRGYLRNQEYAAKAQALEEDRQTTAQQRQRYTEAHSAVAKSYDDLLEFVGTLVPPEPGYDLARNDPAAYSEQMALRNEVLRELNQLGKRGQALKETNATVSQAEVAEYRAKEDKALMAARPGLNDPGRLSEFKAANLKFAEEEAGFTKAELATVGDHRLHQIMAWARLGKRAEDTRKNAKQTAKPVTATPNKGPRPVRQVTRTNTNNLQAKRRLAQTGSLEDALKIDFD